MSGPLSLSPDAMPVLNDFGAERRELVTIEDALPDPAAVVAIAARHSYRPIGPFYPGLRAPVSEAVAMPLIAPIADYLRATFKLDGSLRYFECYLSLVTAAPADLAPIQRLPHFDGVEPDRIAVLLYLDAKERGGTAFYRQRTTGFESVDEGRYAAYREALDASVAEHGLPPPAYISGNTPLFDRVHAVEGRFNRLIAYRGNSLHCADLGPGFSPVARPAEGRLTLNLFLRATSPD